MDGHLHRDNARHDTYRLRLPLYGFTPAIGVGIVSTIVLVIIIAARYAFRLSGSWRWIYAGGAVLSFYLNFFVLIVQSFQKIPALNAYAPTGSEPPFAITQGIALLAFVVAGALSVGRSSRRPPERHTARSFRIRHARALLLEARATNGTPETWPKT